LIIQARSLSGDTKSTVIDEFAVMSLL